MKYLTCLRPINLLIVLLTQLAVYHSFFLSSPVVDDIQLSLYPKLIYLFCVVTVLVTAAGYLINDYFDEETDRLNQKSNKLSKYSNLRYYFILVLLGFGIALWIAIQLGNASLTIIYLICIYLLYLYSASWKKRVLIGNMLVSIFCAGVYLIFAFAESKYLRSLVDTEMIFQLVLFSLFAYLISMVRELIKDLEDIEGDRLAGYLTLPIVHGKKSAHQLVIVHAILLIAVISFWIVRYNDISNLLLILVIGVSMFLPIGYIILKLYNQQINYTNLSRISKYMMLAGFLLLIITRWN